MKDAEREATFLEAKLDPRELRRRRAEAAKERAEASDRVMRLLQVDRIASINSRFFSPIQTSFFKFSLIIIIDYYFIFFILNLSMSRSNSNIVIWHSIFPWNFSRFVL